LWDHRHTPIEYGDLGRGEKGGGGYEQAKEVEFDEKKKKRPG